MRKERGGVLVYGTAIGLAGMSDCEFVTLVTSSADFSDINKFEGKYLHNFIYLSKFMRNLIQSKCAFLYLYSWSNIFLSVG